MAIRIVHRCPFVSANDPFMIINEKPLETYVQWYIRKRLMKMHKSALEKSLFLEDIFFWKDFKKNKERFIRAFFQIQESEEVNHET
jgi:hypothetical protein